MSVVDVVNNYDWKVSPNSNIVEQPYIILREYRIHKSPLLAQLSYTVKAGVENLGGGIKGVLAALAPEGSENKALQGIEGLLNFLGDGAEKVSDFITTSLDTIETSVGVGAVEEDLSGNLKPFQGLYYLKKTNFTYKLPYFSGKMIERGSSWSDQYSGSSDITSLIQDGINFIASKGSGIPILGPFAEPGLYIERAKYFQPMPGQDPITVKFPLLNTLNSESIQKNFNLIWLLCFQNSSMRRNKTDVFPPCIYRVLIPGVRFMLYASIQNITIEYVGTRRRMPIVHPATGETIDTAIPEAYNVEITINSLTTECGNFLLESLTDNL
jgi:TATA-box binding protein (TBP) (component of TFIID and TFIIIB)